MNDNLTIKIIGNFYNYYANPNILADGTTNKVDKYLVGDKLNILLNNALNFRGNNPVKAEFYDFYYKNEVWNKESQSKETSYSKLIVAVVHGKEVIGDFIFNADNNTVTAKNGGLLNQDLYELAGEFISLNDNKESKGSAVILEGKNKEGEAVKKEILGAGERLFLIDGSNFKGSITNLTSKSKPLAIATGFVAGEVTSKEVGKLNYANFSIGCSTRYPNDQNLNKEAKKDCHPNNTEWYNIQIKYTSRNPLANFDGSVDLKKGDKVTVCGDLSVQAYEKDGIVSYFYKIEVSNFDKNTFVKIHKNTPPLAKKTQETKPQILDDEIPF